MVNCGRVLGDVIDNRDPTVRMYLLKVLDSPNSHLNAAIILCISWFSCVCLEVMDTMQSEPRTDQQIADDYPLLGKSHIKCSSRSLLVSYR